MRLKQEMAAELANVARATLSHIESGRTAPSPATLDALLAAYELDWDAVAIPGTSGGCARVFIGNYRGDQLIGIGQAIRAGRRRAGLSLRGLAVMCGLSAAQLSRIERGQVAGGNAFIDDPEDRGLDVKDRRVVLVNEVLRSLLDPGK